MKNFWFWEKAAQVSGTQSGQNLINTWYISLGKCTAVLQKPSSSSSFVHYSICFVGGTISGNWREQPADNHRQRKQVNTKGRKKQCIGERGKVREDIEGRMYLFSLIWPENNIGFQRGQGLSYYISRIVDITSQLYLSTDRGE